MSTRHDYPTPHFDELFKSFEHTAYRLEVRDRYNAPGERVAAFLAGDLDAEDIREGWWLPNVREATAAGRRFERVRVVSMPPSEYSRYGLFTSRHNIDAGEDIRYLVRTEAQELELPDHDYWLFDSRTLVRLHFDDSDDHLVSVEIIEDDHEQIVKANHWRDAAWHYALKRGDFVAGHAIKGVGD